MRKKRTGQHLVLTSIRSTRSRPLFERLSLRVGGKAGRTSLPVSKQVAFLTSANPPLRPVPLEDQYCPPTIPVDGTHTPRSSPKR